MNTQLCTKKVKNINVYFDFKMLKCIAMYKTVKNINVDFGFKVLKYIAMYKKVKNIK